jgi:hypothetical protein
MNSQLIHDVFSKFETSQFQFKRNNQSPLKSISGPESQRIDNKPEPDSSLKNENALRKDKTGRYFLGQQYVWALINWLADYPPLNLSGFFSNEIYTNVSTWLGNKTPQKEKLVRIIVAKLTHDWKSLKRFNHSSENKGLAYFAYSMEIWNITFPEKLDLLLQDIGKIEAKNIDPNKSHSIDKDEKTNIEKEFAIICNLMNSGTVINSNSLIDKNDLIKNWLIASITTTLKDQTGFTGLFSGFIQKT